MTTHLCLIWKKVGDAFRSYKCPFKLAWILCWEKNSRKGRKLGEQLLYVYFEPFERSGIGELLKTLKKWIK